MNRRTLHRLATLPALGAVALAGCTYSLHQVATGGFDRIPRTGEARPVKAEAEQFVFLYLTGNTDFADEAYEQLLDQCPGGELHAIEAHHSTSHGFLSFTNHLRMRALCIE